MSPGRAAVARAEASPDYSVFCLSTTVNLIQEVPSADIRDDAAPVPRPERSTPDSAASRVGRDRHCSRFDQKVACRSMSQASPSILSLLDEGRTFGALEMFADILIDCFKIIVFSGEVNSRSSAHHAPRGKPSALFGGREICRVRRRSKGKRDVYLAQGIARASTRSAEGA